MADRTLNDEEVCLVIENYIHRNLYRYAVMLDGEWGSGKTYFVKNHLKSRIETLGRKMIYVSLYGMKTTEEIDEEIIRSVVMSRAADKMGQPKGNGSDIIFQNAFSGFGRATLKLMMKVSQEEGRGFLQNIFDECHDPEKWFYVFDDIERNLIPVTEILGYINRMVENDGAKVLVVANEKECGSTREEAVELQMIAAAMYRDFLPDNGNMHDNKEMREHRNIRRIRKFIADIFEKEELYRKTKEKVIGKTIRYETSLEKVVNGIVIRIFEGINQEYERVICDSCMLAMKAEQCANLRILEYVLSEFYAVYEIIRALSATEETKKEVVKRVIVSMVTVAIRLRVPHPEYKWDINWKNEEAYATIDCLSEGRRAAEASERMRVYFFSFRFVHEYMLTGHLNEEAALLDLGEYAKRLDVDRAERESAYAIAQAGYWTLNEEVFKKLVEEMEGRLTGKEYSFVMALKVFVLILEYRVKLGLEYCDPDRVFDELMKQIKEGTMQVNLNYDLIIQAEDLDPEVKQEYTQYMERIRAAQKSREILDIAKEYDCLQEEGWSEELYNRVARNGAIDKLVKAKRFLSFLDIPLILDRLKQGVGEDYMNVARTLNVVYSFRTYSEFLADEESISKLRDGLNDYSVQDRLIDRARSTLIKHVDNHLQKLREYHN